MKIYKIFAFAGTICIVIALYGFLFIMPQYDTELNAHMFNLKQSDFHRSMAENFASTYTILKEMNASEKVLEFASNKAITNFRFAIDTLDSDNTNEKKNELNKMNSSEELNTVYTKTIEKFETEYNQTLSTRNSLNSIFLFLNIMGFLFEGFATLIKKD